MKCWIVICCLFLFSGFTQPKEVKNPDQPEKGDWSFSPQKQWETDIAGKDILVEIRDIQISGHGHIYVLDGKLNKVHVFDPEGKYLYSYAKRGEGPGEIKDAFALFFVDNFVIIPDINKIHYFSINGKYIKSIPAPAMFVPYLFLDEYRVLAVPFSSFRKEKREVWLYNLKTKDQRELFKIPKVRALRWSGEQGRLMLRMPFEVAEELIVFKNGEEIWYGYNDAYKIQQLNLDKKDRNSFSIDSRKREKIAKKEKMQMFEKVLENQREIPKNILNTMADQIPDEMPFFHHLFSDKTGLIYVVTATAKYPNRRKVDIFSSQGRYLYRGLIDLEPGCSIIRMIMKGKDLVVFIEDSEGERKLVKYTLDIPANQKKI